MANTNRRLLDKNGYQFMPMNVQGGYIETRFMTSAKWITLAGIIGSAAFLWFLLLDSTSTLGYMVVYLIWLIVSIQLARYIIFEEKFYYRMYLKMKESQITTPAEFWNISSIDNTPEGAIMTFTDARIGVILRLDRDTVTGKAEEFKEYHYDAISDFYKELITMKYSFVQMNLMELAENDPRLRELSKVVTMDSNKNVCNIIEEQFGYIKNITRRTLYESDYVLVYTQDMSKIDMILSDVIDCAYKLLDGAYIGYGFLDQKDIINLVKEKHSVTYFDATEATMVMSKNIGVNIKTPFTLDEIVFTDGKSQKIGRKELYKINKITSDIMNGTESYDNMSIKKAVYIEENKKDLGVNFDSISDGFGGQSGSGYNKVQRQPVRNSRPSNNSRRPNNVNRPPINNRQNIPNQNKQRLTTDNSNDDDYLDL